MGAHGPLSLIAREPVSGRWRLRPATPNRWLLFALVTTAIVPADEGGGAWAMAAVFAVAAAVALARRALVRAAAKVEAALDDELDHR